MISLFQFFLQIKLENVFKCLYLSFLCFLDDIYKSIRLKAESEKAESVELSFSQLVCNRMLFRLTLIVLCRYERDQHV